MAHRATSVELHPMVVHEVWLIVRWRRSQSSGYGRCYEPHCPATCGRSWHSVHCSRMASPFSLKCFPSWHGSSRQSHCVRRGPETTSRTGRLPENEVRSRSPSSPPRTSFRFVLRLGRCLGADSAISLSTRAALLERAGKRRRLIDQRRPRALTDGRLRSIRPRRSPRRAVGWIAERVPDRVVAIEALHRRGSSLASACVARLRSPSM